MLERSGVLARGLEVQRGMDHRVTHVIERMHERLHTEAALDTLAAEVGLSTSRLGFLFRLETGVSPGAFLHRLRMERARVLLESTSLSVGDVMRQVGLADPSHFARDFRSAYGLSPRAYRVQLRMAGPPTRYTNGTQTAPRAAEGSHNAAVPARSGTGVAQSDDEH